MCRKGRCGGGCTTPGCACAIASTSEAAGESTGQSTVRSRGEDHAIRLAPSWAALPARVALPFVGVAVADGRRAPVPQAGPTRATSFASRASIRAIGNARFFRAQPPPDEIVRLDDGRIELDVNPLAAGERFRVVTDAGEVEVRGTIFEVLAAHR